MKNTMNKGISADLFKKTAPRNLREQMGINDVTIFFDMDNPLQNEAGYFASLPCNDGARDCVKALKKLGFNVRVFNGENKSEQVRNMGYDLTKTILVDDYCKNLSDWIEAGGLAIKKS